MWSTWIKRTAVEMDVVLIGDSMVGELSAAPSMPKFRALHGNVQVQTNPVCCPVDYVVMQVEYVSEPSMDTSYFEERLCKPKPAQCYRRLMTKLKVGRTVGIFW